MHQNGQKNEFFVEKVSYGNSEVAFLGGVRKTLLPGLEGQGAENFSRTVKKL